MTFNQEETLNRIETLTVGMERAIILSKSALYMKPLTTQALLITEITETRFFTADFDNIYII